MKEKWLWPILFFTLLLFVVFVGILGPQRAHKRCLEKGGIDTVGRDMLCFDKDGRLVR